MSALLHYKVVISQDATNDIVAYKDYIIQHFQYREYAENFSKKIRKAVQDLTLFAKGYEKTDFVVEGKNIYYKPYSTYLIFYTVEDMEVVVARVLKDGMHWQAVMNRTKKITK